MLEDFVDLLNGNEALCFLAIFVLADFLSGGNGTVGA